MSDHKRQHWLPDTYLGAWCDPDSSKQNPGRVYRYGRDGRYRDYRPPSRIFTVDDLYTAPDADGGRNLETEHALTRLEDRFSRLRDGRLVRGQPLSDEDRRDLIWFVAALRNRSPAMHSHHARFKDRVLEIARSAEAALNARSPEKRHDAMRGMRPPSSPEDRENSVSLDEFRKEAAAPFGAYLPRHIVIEAGILEQMQVAILRAHGPEALITSDRPVSWWDPTDPPPNLVRALGLGRRNIEVTVPLTPLLCARISHHRGPDYLDLGAHEVDEINMRTLYLAREVFISCSPHLVVDWLDAGNGADLTSTP